MLLKSKKFVNASLWRPANKRCLPFPPHANSFRKREGCTETGRSSGPSNGAFHSELHKKREISNKSLALSASYDRLATVRGPVVATSEISPVAAVGKISSLCLEVDTLG